MKISKLVFCCWIILSINHAFSQEIFPAVMHGDLDRVKILIEEHPEWINATSWGGWTPLHRASQFGYGEIVDFLISKGSHLEARTNLGITPLYAAIIGQRSDVVKQLIDKGADVLPSGATVKPCSTSRRLWDRKNRVQYRNFLLPAYS